MSVSFAANSRLVRPSPPPQAAMPARTKAQRQPSRVLETIKTAGVMTGIWWLSRAGMEFLLSPRGVPSIPPTHYTQSQRLGGFINGKKGLDVGGVTTPDHLEQFLSMSEGHYPTGGLVPDHNRPAEIFTPPDWDSVNIVPGVPSTHTGNGFELLKTQPKALAQYPIIRFSRTPTEATSSAVLDYFARHGKLIPRDQLVIQVLSGPIKSHPKMLKTVRNQLKRAGKQKPHVRIFSHPVTTDYPHPTTIIAYGKRIPDIEQVYSAMEYTGKEWYAGQRLIRWIGSQIPGENAWFESYDKQLATLRHSMKNAKFKEVEVHNLGDNTKIVEFRPY